MVKFVVSRRYKYRFDGSKQGIYKCAVETRNIVGNHILIDDDEFDEYLKEVMFTNSNLGYTFEYELNEPLSLEDKIEKSKMLSRFIPSTHRGRTKVKVVDLEREIERNLDANEEYGSVSYYSFFAEGLMGVVLKDLYGYSFKKCLIDINQTLSGVEQGVDGSFYSEKNKTYILGEAKFYKSYSDGINKIIDNFSTNIKNKLDHFYITNSIYITDIQTEQTKQVTREDFYRDYNIAFCGFILHNKQSEYRYKSKKKYKTIKQMKDEVVKEVDKNLDLNLRYVLYLHIPVSEKKEFIKKVVLVAARELEKISGDQIYE